MLLQLTCSVDLMKAVSTTFLWS